MKLSFSIPQKPSSRSNPIRPSHTFDDSSTKDTDPNKQFVTEFDASKPSSDPNNSTNVVIPPIENEWRPLKRMKNLELPITDSNNTQLGFEPDTSCAAELGSDMSYGLNLRQTRKNDGDGEKPDATGTGGDDDNRRLRPVSTETVILQKFKDDLERLPEHQGMEEFKDVSVDGFGAALLAGYGWTEGMGIGKNAKEDVKVVRYERRTAKEGLGFVSDRAPNRSKKEVERPKEKKEVEKLKENGKDEYSVGKSVRLVRGRDAGLKGRIVRKTGDDWVVLRLLSSEEEVKVQMDHVAELGSVEEERCLKKLKELKIQRVDRDKSSKHKRGRDDYDQRRERGEVEEKRVDFNGDRQKDEQGKKQVSWLTSHIRVRVISRDFKGGRLYLKKGEVLDVIGPTTCDISMDDSKEIIQGISQDVLETAIPRCGGPVLVLYGKHKGVYGSLVERDLDREIGVVRDADTQELHSVRLEQIAEYIGDPSFLGY